MRLTDKEKQYGEYSVKGYEGEKQFDHFTDALTSNCMILNDLFLEVDGRVFQLDTTIITAEQIFIFEVKNYVGDFYDEKERLYHIITKKS